MFGLVPFGRKNNKAVGNANAPQGLFDIFNDPFFNTPFPQLSPLADHLRLQDSFRVDVRDNGDRYELTADLPGVTKENIRLDYQNGYLTIAAEKDSQNEEKQEDGYLCRERYHGSFSRSFYIDDVDEKGITAAFKDGVLKVALPKLGDKVPASHRIAID